MKMLFASIFSLLFINFWLIIFNPFSQTIETQLQQSAYCLKLGPYLMEYDFSLASETKTKFSLIGPTGETPFVLTKSQNFDQIFLQYPITNDDHYIADYYSPLVPIFISRQNLIKTFVLHHWVFDQRDCKLRHP
jgi:hypothetical protein